MLCSRHLGADDFGFGQAAARCCYCQAAALRLVAADSYHSQRAAPCVLPFSCLLLTSLPLFRPFFPPILLVSPLPFMLCAGFVQTLRRHKHEPYQKKVAEIMHTSYPPFQGGGASTADADFVREVVEIRV